MNKLTNEQRHEFCARMAFNLALSNWEDKPEKWGYKSHADMYDDLDNLEQYESHENEDLILQLCYDYEHCDLDRALMDCYVQAEYVVDMYEHERGFKNV